MMRKFQTPPPLSLVRAAFVYDKETGDIFRKGVLAGYEHRSSGYRVVKFNGRAYPIHLLAWYIETGEWRPNGLDHRDCNRTNNRWENLRACSQSDNLANAPCHSNNKCGVKGVHRHKPTGKYRAQIKKNGRVHHLGLFDSLERAAEAYAIAAAALHGEFARLR